MVWKGLGGSCGIGFQGVLKWLSDMNAQCIEFSVKLTSNFSLNLLNSFPNLHDAMDRGVRLERGRELFHSLRNNVNGVEGKYGIHQLPTNVRLPRTSSPSPDPPVG